MFFFFRRSVCLFLVPVARALALPLLPSEETEDVIDAPVSCNYPFVLDQGLKLTS